MDCSRIRIIWIPTEHGHSAFDPERLFAIVLAHRVADVAAGVLESIAHDNILITRRRDLKAPRVEMFGWLAVGLVVIKPACSSVSLV